ncbi:MAG: HAD hydrolase family protein [Candidatus Hydrogenedentes bacterium]|nr:HAD hydrolase family protein [Candidatus Hydrogenedentota bacterium]
MAYKWIISDIDGCLSPEGSYGWNWENFKLLVDFFNSRKKRNGKYPVPLILCTGRPQPYVEVWAKILDLRAPLICENGAVIYYLPTNTSIFGPGITIEKIEGLRKVRRYIEMKVLPSYPDVVYQFGKEAQISLFSENPEVFGKIKEEILDFVGRLGGPELVIQPSHFYLNISLAGVNKGEAIKMVYDEVGINKMECVGIGDTLGDLPLRENVVFFACPNNAQTEVKEVADYVSPYSDMLGVLDILKLDEFKEVWGE